MTERQCRTNGWVYLYVWSCLVIGASQATAKGSAPVIGDVELNRNRHVALGVPAGNEDHEIIISRSQYVVAWDSEHRGPGWVGWELTRKQLGSVGRSNVFRVDHDLVDYLNGSGAEAVKPDEYKGSCLDRGHQIPSADRTAALSDNQSTFFMSNMAPQAAHLNRVTWASLEKFLRHLVQERGKELSIYTGTSYENDDVIGTNDDIAVPSKNFKIIVIKPAGTANIETSSMRLLITDFPNVTSKNTDPVTDNDQACYDSQHTMRLAENNVIPYWRKHIVPLSTIQTESGLNFSFLMQIPVLSGAELDQLLQDQYKNIQPYTNLMQKMGDAIQGMTESM